MIDLPAMTARLVVNGRHTRYRLDTGRIYCGIDGDIVQRTASAGDNDGYVSVHVADPV